jgi:hypothetical protein
MELDDYSRFAKTEKVIVDGHDTYGRWSSYSFLTEQLASNEIGSYRVGPATENRPDMISNAIYGTPLLDWVLIAFNNVTDVLNWPKSGMIIKYPAEAIVMPEILQRND